MKKIVNITLLLVSSLFVVGCGGRGSDHGEACGSGIGDTELCPSEPDNQNGGEREGEGPEEAPVTTQEIELQLDPNRSNSIVVTEAGEETLRCTLSEMSIPLTIDTYGSNTVADTRFHAGGSFHVECSGSALDSDGTPLTTEEIGTSFDIEIACGDGEDEGCYGLFDGGSGAFSGAVDLDLVVGEFPILSLPSVPFTLTYDFERDAISAVKTISCEELSPLFQLLGETCQTDTEIQIDIGIVPDEVIEEATPEGDPLQNLRFTFDPSASNSILVTKDSAGTEIFSCQFSDLSLEGSLDTYGNDSVADIAFSAGEAFKGDCRIASIPFTVTFSLGCGENLSDPCYAVFKGDSLRLLGRTGVQFNLSEEPLQVEALPFNLQYDPDTATFEISGALSCGDESELTPFLEQFDIPCEFEGGIEIDLVISVNPAVDL